MKARIIWSNKEGCELDSKEVRGDEYAGAITKAFHEFIGTNIVTPGDTFTVEEIEG